MALYPTARLPPERDFSDSGQRCSKSRGSLPDWRQKTTHAGRFSQTPSSPARPTGIEPPEAARERSQPLEL